MHLEDIIDTHKRTPSDPNYSRTWLPAAPSNGSPGDLRIIIIFYDCFLIFFFRLPRRPFGLVSTAGDA